MQVKIYVKEEDLEEISSFLKSSLNYEHAIDFSTIKQEGQIELLVYYDDYVKLRDWKINETVNRNVTTSQKMTLYQEIENSIIEWSIDGTRTAGTLTRKILKIMNLM